MDYKRLLPSKKLRVMMLDLLSFIPDKTMIKLQYKIKTGRVLDLHKPTRYTEKIQLYKLKHRDPLLKRCSDKYEVRAYIKEKGLERILSKVYGIYSRSSEINYNALPNSFALKSTRGSGDNYFVHDKTKENLHELNKRIDSWLTKKSSNLGREWCYNDIVPRVICEELLPRNEKNDIPDFKFFCFNGKVKYLYVMIDYVDNHKQGRCSFYTPEFIKLPYRRSEYDEIQVDISAPQNFKEMIYVSEILSKDFPHVRVDLYDIRGEVRFGELTFYSASGYTVFSPDDFDFILGREFTLPE